MTAEAADSSGQGWLLRRTGIAATPPPLTRHSSSTVLAEESRPRAPEPPPSVVFSPQGVAVGRHLVAVHDQYRAELTQVRDILQQVRSTSAQLDEALIGAARSELNQLTIRANDWTLGGYCQAQCLALAQHHGMESEAIFPHLRRRQADLADVLDRLDSEHHAIHEVLVSIDAALVHLAQHPADYAPISAAVDLLTDTLTSHFAYEEEQLVGPLALHGFFPGHVQPG